MSEPPSPSANMGSVPCWRRTWVLARTEPLLGIPAPLLFVWPLSSFDLSGMGFGGQVQGSHSMSNGKLYSKWL